jgi:hypothetical protein
MSTARRPRTRSQAALDAAERGGANGAGGTAIGAPRGGGKAARPPSLAAELPSMALLTLLYFIQGVPLGLTMGSVCVWKRGEGAAGKDGDHET